MGNLQVQVDLGVDLDSRVAIVGPNGAGKSTLLKLMTGGLEPLDGMVKRHNHLKIGMYHQHLTELLDPKLTPLEYMVRAHACSPIAPSLTAPRMIRPTHSDNYRTTERAMRSVFAGNALMDTKTVQERSMAAYYFSPHCNRRSHGRGWVVNSTPVVVCLGQEHAPQDTKLGCEARA